MQGHHLHRTVTPRERPMFPRNAWYGACMPAVLPAVVLAPAWSSAFDSHQSARRGHAELR